MHTTVWNIFAPVYEWSMRSQKQIYDYIYENAAKTAKDKDVLELATGPGLIAKNIANSAKSIIATDFAENMIKTAKKGYCPPNVSFEIADACNLQYDDNRFDVVIIASALHIMPNPEKALQEIDRVMKPGGTLIAPNYIFSGKKNLWQRFLSLIGIKFAHEWTAEQYSAFLSDNGWSITKSQIVEGRIDLIYVECKKVDQYKSEAKLFD